MINRYIVVLLIYIILLFFKEELDMTKKSIVFILIVLFFVLTMPVLASTELTDIEGHWGQEVIEKLVELGAISGYPDGTFKPNTKVTKAEFAKMLCNALELDIKNGNAFIDTTNHWAKDEIYTLAISNIISTSEYNNSFNPDAFMSRGEAVKLLVNAMGFENSYMDVYKTPTKFVDIANIEETDLNKYVNIAAEYGVLSGYPDGTFKPKGLLTRAEAAKAVTLLKEYLIGENLFIYMLEDTLVNRLHRVDGSNLYSNGFITINKIEFRENNNQNYNQQQGHFFVEIDFQNSIDKSIKYNATSFELNLYIGSEVEQSIIDTYYLKNTGNPSLSIELQPGESYIGTYTFVVNSLYNIESHLENVDKLIITYKNDENKMDEIILYERE